MQVVQLIVEVERGRVATAALPPKWRGFWFCSAGVPPARWAGKARQCFGRLQERRARRPPDSRRDAGATKIPIRWQEWVFTTSHTSLPGCSWSESRAASVRWTSISTPQFTFATTITSRCASETTRPGIMLRALNPTGLKRSQQDISRAGFRLATPSPHPPAPAAFQVQPCFRTAGTPWCRGLRGRQRPWHRRYSRSRRVAPRFPGAARVITWCGVPCAMARPFSSTITCSPSANTSSRLCVTYTIGIPMLLVPGAQVIDNLRLGGGIQRRQRFVQQKDCGIDHQGAGQCDSLPLSTGNLPGPARAQMGDAERFQNGGAALLALFAAASRERPYSTLPWTVRCGNSARS